MSKQVEVISLSEVIAHQIIPTEKFFTKKDSEGKVVNKYPGMYAVRCEYRGNPNYVFFATEKEVSELRGVTRKEFDELCAEVNLLRQSLPDKKK